MSIKNCYNVADFRKVAKRKLPHAIFEYMDGGAEDEITLRQNVSAFDHYSLIPETLVDVSSIDTKTKVLGVEMDLPFFCGPSGASRLYHQDKEFGVATAADELGIIYSLATFGTASIEEIGAATKGPKMFQVYVFKDRGISLEFLSRAKAQILIAFASQ